MQPKKPVPVDEKQYPFEILPDGTINLIERDPPPFEPSIVDDDPFLEPDESDPDDEADEAQDRASGALSDDH